mgnify:CR=1 FL=1
MLRLTLPWKERDCRMANRGPTFFAKALSRYFFEYLPSERGLSQETIQSYRDAMSLLLDFCERERKIRRDRLEVSDFNRELIDAFFRWLEQEKGNSITTRNQRRAAINAFFKSCSMKIQALYCYANRFGKFLRRNVSKGLSRIFRKKPSKLFLDSRTLQRVRDGVTLPS